METDIIIKPQIPKFKFYLHQKWITIAIGSAVSLFGIYIFNFYVFLLGLLILQLSYSSAKRQKDIDFEKTNWYLENQGRILIYYAAKKHIQIEFKQLLNELCIHETEIYYNGPKLESTIPIPKSVKTAISKNEYEFRGPAVLKLEDYRIKRVIDLNEIKNLQPNRRKIVDKLNGIKKL